jgi:hypothetical protein
MRLICYFVGHEPFMYDELADGTKIRGCPRCGAYVRRDTSDPRRRANDVVLKGRVNRGKLRVIHGGRAA